MSRTKQEELLRRERAVLALVARESNGGRRLVQLSRRQLASRMGMDWSRVRYTLTKLVERGMLRKHARFSSDGSQVPNAYQLTDLGWARLRETPDTYGPQD